MKWYRPIMGRDDNIAETSDEDGCGWWKEVNTKRTSKNSVNVN